MTYKPPFNLNDEILALVADIAQKIGKVEAFQQLNRNPRLRKENRIRTIHSSLAIENNTLSLEQVTAVVEGKRVLAPPKDLLEVQNAIAVYDALDAFDPVSVDDLLRAHRMLMGGLIEEAGIFRSGNVGVFDGDALIHAGTPARYVPKVIADLFAWLRASGTHPLVSSCIFHYEFEFIHPFQDGNGRMGRLWQTLILSKWNPVMAWLPVESLVKDNQEAYYAALGRSDSAANSTEFITFMLGMIGAALDEVGARKDDSGMAGEAMPNEQGNKDLANSRQFPPFGANWRELEQAWDGLSNQEQDILLCLEQLGPSYAVAVASYTGTPLRSTQRALKRLVDAELVCALGETRRRTYALNRPITMKGK